VKRRSPLFVILGHEGCGAVAAAVATMQGGAQERERIALLLDTIIHSAVIG
jgi:carbonic anhydrase